MFLNLSSSYVALLVMSIICIITIILHYAYCLISGKYTFFGIGLIGVVLYWNYQYMNTLFNVISIFILFFVWLLSILICINYVKETSNLHINNDELDIESQYQTTQHN
jgi:uncharacterized membrane protein